MIRTRKLQNMLGAVGFIIGAISVGAFALSAKRAYGYSLDIRKVEAFSLGFLFLAVAMALWALVAIVDSSQFTHRVLLASDILLVAGSLCMGRVLLNKVHPVVALATVTLGSLAIASRAYVFQPVGYVENGLLYFNLNGGVREVILCAFIVVWLPAVLVVSRALAADPALAFLRKGLVPSFVTLICASAVLLSARRPAVIIFSFIAIVGLFLVMAYVNVQIKRVHELVPTAKPTRRKHHAAGTAKA